MSFQIIEHDDGRSEFILNENFRCESGEIIRPLTLVYETYGTLSEKKDNIIVIHHALSTSSHVSSHSKNPTKGWWEEMVGANKPINTDRFFVICINNIGSCFGSSGPASINPETDQPYAETFPTISITDIVRSQKLLLSCLGFDHIHVLIGNSMGGMMALTWAVLYPNDVDRLISVSSCYKSYPANYANRAMQKEIIHLDPVKPPIAGFKVARKHALVTYRNFQELNIRFKDKTGDESIDNYLEYNSTKFINNFDVYSYLCLLETMDRFNLSQYGSSISDVFSKIKASVLIVSVDSDVLYTPDQQMDLFNALETSGVEVEFIQHHSDYGHDAFLVETDVFGQYLTPFISLD